MAAWLQNLAAASLTVLALALVLVALRAWWHARSDKVLYLAIAFGLILAKGLVLTVALFLPAGWSGNVVLSTLMLDLGVLVLFYAAVLRKSAA